MSRFFVTRYSVFALALFAGVATSSGCDVINDVTFRGYPLYCGAGQLGDSCYPNEAAATPARRCGDELVCRSVTDDISGCDDGVCVNPIGDTCLSDADCADGDEDSIRCLGRRCG